MQAQPVKPLLIQALGVNEYMSKVTYNHPIYVQLREAIRSKIESGEYLPGVAIPPEQSLATKYGVSHLTVRSAIESLVKEGLLKPVHGKGVYVTHKVERDLEVLEGFTHATFDIGLLPTTKVLKKEKIKAGKRFAKIFNIDENDYVYFIKRLDYHFNDPVAIEQIYIPYSLFPKFEGLDLKVFTLYEIYEFYNILPKRAYQTLEITKLDQSNARSIGLNKDDAVILFTCTTYDEHEKVIEYSKVYSRGDISKFRSEFKKKEE